MSADVAHELQRESEYADAERALPLAARIVLALGPLTAAAGVAWAFAQPWRLTVLHPYGQGFWWLVAEPPLYVVLVGLLFRGLLAPGIVADVLAAEDGGHGSRASSLAAASASRRAERGGPGRDGDGP